MALMNNIKDFISKKWEPLFSKKIFVACSGGVDSITLLSIFKELKFDVEALHVNYNLRGQDSIDDQNFVKTFCKDNNIPFHLKTIYLGEHLEKNGGNLQEEARKIRYAFFEEFKLKSSNNFIALGHHLDDQVETFFMHIARKSGVLGMSCMLDKNEQYIRPFLSFKKQEIIEYANSKRILWREDVTNQTNKYTRNILRNILIPEIKESFPNIEQSISTLIEVFQENQKKTEKTVSPIIDNITFTNQLTLKQYKQLSKNEKFELLRRLNLKHGYIKELDKLSQSQKGKFISIESKSITFIYNEGDYFHFIENNTVKSDVPKLVIKNASKLPETFTSSSIYLDSEKIKGKLQLRTWKSGDRMKPIGLKGSKLISDIIKDAKVPSHQKNEILVLTDDENILWCVNHKVSSIANANTSSKSILQVSLG